MKKLLFLLVFSISFSLYAQEDAWVYFNEKPNSQYYFDNPLEMLSQRALDRRTTQNIALDFFDIPVHQPYIDQVDAVNGITVKAKSKWMNSVHVRGTTTAINSLTTLPFVGQIDFANNSLNSTNKVAAPVKIKVAKKANQNTFLDTQTNYLYGNSANQIQMLNGHLLHQQDFSGTGKIIAVLDAGFPQVNVAQPFQNLLNNNKILGGYNFVDRNTNFYTRNSHGTLVLSTMGGYTENQLVGTAPEASYYLFITEDTDSENPVEESLWVEAAEMADSLGVDIINSSLGYFTYDNPAYSYTYADMNGTTSFVSRGADKAFSKGMIVVVSAGNSGNSSNPNIGVPADGINVLTVGAVTATENYANFSSIGPSFDGRVKPDVMAQGQSAVLSNTSGNITTASGTSFSSPIMAGMIASFWQALPNKTNAEIIQLVKQSSDLYTTPNAQFGYGIPDFNLALANGLAVNTFTKPNFTVFPNPAGSRLSVAFPDNYQSANVTFFTALGQKVLEQKAHQDSPIISLQALNPGMYLYKIQSDSYTKTGKIIKE